MDASFPHKKSQKLGGKAHAPERSKDKKLRGTDTNPEPVDPAS